MTVLEFLEDNAVPVVLGTGLVLVGLICAVKIIWEWF